MGTIEKMFIALGTVNQITAHFDESGRETARLALEKAEEYIDGMDDRLSVFKPESEISQINANAGKCDTLLSRDTFELLRLCVKYGELTGGVFDITTKPLTDAEKTKARINYHDILLDKNSLSARLKRPNQGIHLGGIAKGYAVDRVAEILERYGVNDAVINLHLQPQSLYERGNHIFDPVSGKPAVNDLASVTVVGKDGAAADVAATACMVLGSMRGVRLLSSLGLEGIFILRNGSMFATKNVRERVKSA